MRYLDDLQTGLVAEEILELQTQMDLDAEDRRSRCDDDDCCSHENEDLPVINEDLLGGTTPPAEKKMDFPLNFQNVLWLGGGQNLITTIFFLKKPNSFKYAQVLVVTWAKHNSVTTLLPPLPSRE